MILVMVSYDWKCSLLVLLHLSSAFDTVDHSFLLDRLKWLVCISGSALNWCFCLLSVSVGKVMSNTAPLPFGVLQGSVLGPIVFSLFVVSGSAN